MKKVIFACMFLLGGITYAQDIDNEQEIDLETGTVWEVKANVAYLFLGVAEGSLEVSLNNNSAIGISGSLPFGSEAKNTIDYLVTPYYRYYFGLGQTKGFFVEGFGLVNSVEKNFPFENDDRFSTDLALGAAIGGKWVFKGGIVLGINFGLGANILNTDEHDFETVSKGAINVGYRF